jgi:UDP-N-acetylglucosamine 4,6-dehydratase
MEFIDEQSFGVQMLSNSTFLITGGTGSFGNTLVSHLLKTDVSEIRIFSRDESKQHYMKQSIQDKRVRFFLGDVRNFDSVSHAVQGADYVFHAAALKHVPAGEIFPWEFTQTNIGGSHNLLRALESSSVQRAVFLSTDKAVYPVNAMGMTKAMMEKLVRSSNYSTSSINLITRYGNVIGSRGSVIPQFISSLQKFGKVQVTNLEMTRFMMSLEDSVSLVLFALENGTPGDLFVQKAPGASVENIVGALALLLKVNDPEIEIVGVRPGEKIHETLLTAEEKFRSLEHDNFFQVSNVGNYDSIKSNMQNLTANEYSSNTTAQLSSEELAELLSGIPLIQDMIR